VQILVIALKSDLHADSVISCLNKKGIDVLRIDPTLDDDLPEKISIYSNPTIEAYFEFIDKIKINPINCNAIFCRFAIDFLIPSSEDPLKNFTSAEALTAFLAPLRMIESSRWINDPWIENRADCKIMQSKIAKDIGLNVPEFIVSSNYSDLLSFYKEYRNVIIKPLSDTTLALVDNKFIKQENLFTDNFFAPYTAKFIQNENINIKNIDNTPTLLQLEINKKSDIRATVIDEKVFAVEMPYNEGNPIDFRLNNNLIKEYNLPNEIREKLIELVKILGLRFASCDLVIDKDNQIYFLESNVQGNWLWTEINENMNISEAIAVALINS
jgi:glutathione synthase/RimK-type ligase-like ATP-grasp enzyme